MWITAGFGNPIRHCLMEEETRKRNTMYQRANRLLVISVAIGLSGSMASAAQRKTKQDAIQLIGSVEIYGGYVRKILLTEHQGKKFLYLEDGSRPAATVVDVTDAAHPVIATKIAMPDGFGSVEVLAGEAALVADRSSALPVRPQSLSIVSLGSFDDRHRVKQTFTNVTAILTDDQRGLIYLVDLDGLKVLRKSIAPDPQLDRENMWRFAP